LSESKERQALEAIADTLEGLSANIKHILNPIKSQPKAEAPKGVEVDLSQLTWEPVAGKSYEISKDTAHPTFLLILKVLEGKEGRPAFFKPYSVWKFDQPPYAGFLGRKKKP